jgi:hypothetical protein
MTIRNATAPDSLIAVCPTSNLAVAPARLSRGGPVQGMFSSTTGLAYDSSRGLDVTQWSASRVTRIDPTGVRRRVTDKARSLSGTDRYGAAR